jgi:hypothetical protein
MVLILLLGVATPWFRMSSFGRILPDRFQEIYRNPSPFGLAKMIRDSGKSCPVFSGWYLGGFLRYSLVNRNFVDGRNSPFSEEVYSEFKQAISGQEGWERYLDRYGACFAVLEEKKEARLVVQIRRSPKWKELGHEGEAVLFERTEN